MTPKSRGELYQQNKEAGIKCSIHRTHGHSDEQCFSQKPTNIHTVEEETAQEEIVTPFKLIGHKRELIGNHERHRNWSKFSKGKCSFQCACWPWSIIEISTNEAPPKVKVSRMFKKYPLEISKQQVLLYPKTSWNPCTPSPTSNINNI